MNNIMKSVILSVFFTLFSIGASAQCVSAPVILGQGYQGGNPCWGGQPLNQVGGQFVNSNNYGAQYSNDMALLQSLMASQQRRRPELEACGWTLGGAIAGATLGSLNSAHRPQAMILAGIIGGALGSAVCENRQREAQAEAAQIAQLQARVRNGNQRVSVPLSGGSSVCVLPTRDRGDLTESECSQLGGVYKGNASAFVSSGQQQVSVGQMSGGCENAPGTRQGILNLPGHPKNNQTVCAKPGDRNVTFL
jgi:hypothetical protein